MKFYAGLIPVFVVVLAMAACAPGGESTTVPGVQTDQPTQQQDPGGSTGAPRPTPEPLDEEAIRALWPSSPHASTYVLSEDGTNSTCARCHAPVNWVPTMEDMPESCASCKFEVDPSPPVIAEGKWDHIQCKVCHRVKRNGKVDSQAVWLAIAPIEDYAELTSTTELCQKCHVPLDVPGHNPVTLENSHADFDCIRCHDAHTTAADCSSQGCHSELTSATPVPGHDQDHQQVSCQACHDGGEMPVGPDETGIWTVFIEADGDRIPSTSHNIQREVLCERCHFPDNPWELSTSVQR